MLACSLCLSCQRVGVSPKSRSAPCFATRAWRLSRSRVLTYGMLGARAALGARRAACRRLAIGMQRVAQPWVLDASRHACRLQRGYPWQPRAEKEDAEATVPLEPGHWASRHPPACSVSSRVLTQPSAWRPAEARQLASLGHARGLRPRRWRRQPAGMMAIGGHTRRRSRRPPLAAAPASLSAAWSSFFCESPARRHGRPGL